MAGIETVVRPQVVPDTRPRSTVLPILETAPQQERFFEIRGNSGKLVDLSHSISYSWERPAEQEKKRKLDVLRVRPTGQTEGNTYLDVEAITKLWTKSSGVPKRTTLAKPGDNNLPENITVIEEDVIRKNQS